MRSGSRRDFLRAAGLAGLGWCGACTSERSPAPGATPAPAGVDEARRMRLSMSVRVAESFSDKKHSSMPLDELIALAQSSGYEALCMRASTAGVQTPPETVAEYAARIRQAGLDVSMVTGDFAIPQNGDDGPDALRNVTPYLDLAEAFGSSLIRVCMKKEEDIEPARRASDEAAERGIRIAHQSHCASLFETVLGTLDVLGRVGRENFGIIYEPANWMVAGEEYGPQTIRRLEPWIFNVYVQNHRLNPEAETKLTTWKRGLVGVDHIGIWEEGGVRFGEVFEALAAIRYTGWVTVHQAFEGVMTVEQAVRRSAAWLQTVIV